MLPDVAQRRSLIRDSPRANQSRRTGMINQERLTNLHATCAMRQLRERESFGIFASLSSLVTGYPRRSKHTASQLLVYLKRASALAFAPK